MALIAEELVQEWLHRTGHFTIRGARVGVYELDLLALRITPHGLVARHIEVACNVRPIGSLGPTKSARLQNEDEQRANVAAWFQTKFHAPGKEALRATLAPGVTWSFEVVTHTDSD
ncbi:hypothetical protein GO986_15110 [Deinococcus sp. HMF7620]|uniref:Uncharacterized protein n=1 Tax=Deinococcus arboris TaxID=2682977 RepID=A0A7C9LVY5_9DEIO|nr:hypothetical protein [Deinococcus arboris]MVN88080.1 hypothetical protein [Deinococcus arboris]